MDINFKDHFKQAQFLLFIIMILTFILSFIIREYDRSIFSFAYFVEIFFLIFIFRSYFRAQIRRNYSFWGITVIVGFYLVRAMLQHSFMDYNETILYLAFTTWCFLLLNSYFMSSPIFYPRVQWWEYDFRFRGDFKVDILIEEKKYEGRLTDLRRNAGCLEAFEYFNLEKNLRVLLNYNGNTFDLPFTIKTISHPIPGRPYRYGILFFSDLPEDKKSFKLLKKTWDRQKSVKLRSKFNIKKTD